MASSAQKQINDLYLAGRKAAVDEMIRLARHALAKHPNLKEFICAMGSVFFTAHGADEHINPEDRSYLKALDNLLTDWDGVYKLSGEGIRFTATGPIVSDW
jgi:hypothetical protein